MRPGLIDKPPVAPAPAITRLLAVDPSIQSGKTGWVVYGRHWRWTATFHGLIDYPRGTKPEGRIAALGEAARGLVDAQKPELILIEGVYRHTGARRHNVSDVAVIQLAKAAGVWEGLGIPFRVIAPDEWLGHFGLWKFTGNKSMIVAYTNTRLREMESASVEDEHRACAALIGLCWIETQG